MRAVNASGNGKVALNMSHPPEFETPGNFQAKAIARHNVKPEWTQTGTQEVNCWEHRVKSAQRPKPVADAGRSLHLPFRAFNDVRWSTPVRDKVYNWTPGWTSDIGVSATTGRAILSWEESHIDLTGYQYRLNFGSVSI